MSKDCSPYSWQCLVVSDSNSAGVQLVTTLGKSTITARQSYALKSMEQGKLHFILQDFEGKVVQSATLFNKLESSPMLLLQGEEGAEIQGPLIDRKCSRCGHEGMTYHTRQMRSADEGQTVFYTCVKCKYQEKEDS
ncbi:DNA-directed RNA polymerase I subunit RPA12 isoform X1 [Rhinatrema bivittatum]|uniref:DNA-directed RNA polymerase I subunit RPA12 isoform X1 n=1 Tax=Rhinatrema bivittatum TaxID=194408 RepID=UPI00112E47EB|nr:DNA-directed RNA polymerase I subunit RPA12 isoform X1 [Rhinatrema bivittatum]